MKSSYKRPKIIGIANITPDSFSDGGCYLDPRHALRWIETMIQDGADGIDIGAESSRPGAKSLDEKDEFERIKILIPLLKQWVDLVPFSIDTTKPNVAKYCLDQGFKWVNDITGGQNQSMLEVVRSFDAGLIVMHMQNNPETMQASPKYYDVVTEVIDFLSNRVQKAKSMGINQLMIDPGLGFGKTLAHNQAILSNLDRLQSLDWPVYVGPSRKAFIGAWINRPPNERDVGTMAVIGYLAHQSIAAVRVHDVKGCVDTLNVWDGIYQHA